MQSAVEISMYPLTGEYRPLIKAFIERLNTYPDMTVKTNALSTQVWGALDRVLSMVAAEIERAASGSARGAPQLVFVMKVLPGLAPP
ncbi:MAG: hypothetical protein ABSD02_16455 [Steroidobacteraceae bacterium]|jgi:uncharacterized protein YqgV (UPF0045/DUF77 family)